MSVEDAPNCVKPEEASSTTSPYAERIDRMSRHAAHHLTQVSRIAHPFSVPHSYVTDDGTGTGRLTEAVLFPAALAMLETLDVKDISGVITRSTEGSQRDDFEAWDPNDEVDPPLGTWMASFTLNPLDEIREMYRLLNPGGLIGIGLWGERTGPNVIWEEACQTLDPEYKLPLPFTDSSAWENQGVSSALRHISFEDIHTEKCKVPFEFENTASYLKFWYKDGNTVANRFVQSFKGDKEEAKKALEQVLKEKYDDARKIFVEIVLATGTK